MPSARLLSLAALASSLWASTAAAQYNAQAGKSAVAEPAPAASAPRSASDSVSNTGGGTAESTTIDRRAKKPGQQPPVQIARDNFGNAAAAKYDLAVDGAFDGQTILIIDYYTDQYSLDFSGPRDAVRTKGFSMVRYNKEPSPAELAKLLAKSNQFWLISSCDNTVHLSSEHHEVIKKFFQAGHGVYLWGDNDPCNADADKLASILVDARVTGDLPGDQTVKISTGAGQAGVVRDHLLSTGVENVYEGVTVATVKPTGKMTPVIYGSAGNLVAAAYEQDGKRLLVDGGFTRLSYKWNTAGTGRYIKNAAAWLANYEKFGTAVIAKGAANQPQVATPKPPAVKKRWWK